MTFRLLSTYLTPFAKRSPHPSSQLPAPPHGGEFMTTINLLYSEFGCFQA